MYFLGDLSIWTYNRIKDIYKDANINIQLMNLALQIGDNRISGDRVLQQLYEAQLLPQLLREMVIDELIDRVASENKIDLTPNQAEFDRLYEQVTEISPFQGMNTEQLATITARTLKLHKFKQAGWGHKISSYYPTVQHQLYRVSYSIFQAQDGLLAQEVFFRIQSGEQSFAQLAIEYSIDPSAPRGGNIGPIMIREIPPAIAQVLDKLSPGELSPLFQLDRNYGFIRLNELIKPQLDEGTHQALIDELFENWIQAQIATEVGADGDISIAPTTAAIKSAPEVDPPSSNPPEFLQPLSDIFSPDFTNPAANLDQIPPAPLPPDDIPDVTVVTEPEDRDLDISTGFFFPAAPKKDRSIKGSNLTAERGSTPADLEVIEHWIDTPELDSRTSPINLAQRRSRILVGTIGIAVALSICTNQYISRYGNPTKFLPEPVKAWMGIDKK